MPIEYKESSIIEGEKISIGKTFSSSSDLSFVQTFVLTFKWLIWPYKMDFFPDAIEITSLRKKIYLENGLIFKKYGYGLKRSFGGLKYRLYQGWAPDWVFQPGDFETLGSRFSNPNPARNLEFRAGSTRPFAHPWTIKYTV